MRAYFIGLCGAGMSATARLLRALGWEVSGSDENFYPPTSTYLEKSDLSFHRGYNPANLPGEVDVFVVGKHAGLTPEENAEVRAAFASGRPVRSFAEVLGEITADRENIVVAGSYGKSTITSLLAWCLEQAGRAPGYFIGAIPETPAHSSTPGTGKLFILEGDEYPAANWDQRAKFLHYHPSHLLITSLAHDHLNVFPGANDYRVPFSVLLQLLPPNGRLAACADGAGVKEILGQLGRPIIYYSAADATVPWHAENIQYGERTDFGLYHNGIRITALTTELLGQHNIENIVGAAAMLLAGGWVTAEQLAQAVAAFKPLQRRLDKLSERTRLPLYEGFGSSLEKARAAIAALRRHYPDRSWLVLFEPHTFSWQSRSALPWYRQAFNGASAVLVYQAKAESNANQLSTEEMVTAIQSSGIPASAFSSPADGLRLLGEQLTESSAVLILSSGSFGGMIKPITEWLEQNFPKL